jgi:hypothetical protein
MIIPFRLLPKTFSTKEKRTTSDPDMATCRANHQVQAKNRLA